jgi:hypothetical protein
MIPSYRWTLLLLIVVLLSACSGLRLGYRHADTLLAWRADEYFDFDPQQRHEFDARLARLLAWHRYEQLPEYAVFVGTAINKARPGLKHDDIVWFIEGMQARYRTIVSRGIDDAVDLLATLKPNQLVALQKQWDKDNRKFSREHAVGESAEHRKRERLTRTIDQIDDWTGRLTVEQEQKVAVLLEPIPYIDDLRYKDRMRRQKEFLELLKLRENKAEFRPKLLAFLLDWEEGRTPEYQRLANEVLEKRVAFYMAVEKLLTPAQRETAVKRLQDYADDFKSLSERGRAG